MSHINRKYSISKKSQAGLSLIELMVAMTLGLILLGGIIQIFLSSKQSYNSVMSSSQVLDNGRLALHFMNGATAKAGYWGADNDVTDRNYGADTGLIADQYTGIFPENQWLFGENNDTSDANVLDGTDELWLRFSGDADVPMITCTGEAVSSTQIAIEHYFVRVLTGSEILPSLVCESTIMGFDQASGIVTVPGTPSTNSTVIISGVENMQLQFGVLNNVGGENARFFSANNITAVNWQRVNSISVSILAASDNEVAPQDRTTGYQMLDVTTSAPNDKRARRVFNQSTVLRNPNNI